MYFGYRRHRWHIKEGSLAEAIVMTLLLIAGISVVCFAVIGFIAFSNAIAPML